MSVSPDAKPFLLPATERSAMDVQALALQDVIAGGWPNPLDLADPDNPDKVEATRKLIGGEITKRRLKRSPVWYLGIENDDGDLAGYMKLGIWDRINQLPFASPEEAAELQKGFGWKGKPVEPATLAIYGLVASERYEMNVRKRMLSTFITEAIIRAQSYQRINIVIHGNDPAQSVVEEAHFEPIATGEATNVPGLEQTFYQRIITGFEY